MDGFWFAANSCSVVDQLEMVPSTVVDACPQVCVVLKPSAGDDDFYLTPSIGEDDLALACSDNFVSWSTVSCTEFVMQT